MSNKNTANFSVDTGETYCSYCHKPIWGYDVMSEGGGYCGQVFQCDCEQAKIEEQMNDEIEEVEKQIQKIKNKYADKLKIDYTKMREIEYKAAIEKVQSDYNCLAYNDKINKIE